MNLKLLLIFHILRALSWFLHKILVLHVKENFYFESIAQVVSHCIPSHLVPLLAHTTTSTVKIFVKDAILGNNMDIHLVDLIQLPFMIPLGPTISTLCLAMKQPLK